DLDSVEPVALRFVVAQPEAAYDVVPGQRLVVRRPRGDHGGSHADHLLGAVLVRDGDELACGEAFELLRYRFRVDAVAVPVGGVAVGKAHDVVNAIRMPQLGVQHGEIQLVCASHNVASTTPVEVCEPVKGGN